MRSELVFRLSLLGLLFAASVTFGANRGSVGQQPGHPMGETDRISDAPESPSPDGFSQSQAAKPEGSGMVQWVAVPLALCVLGGGLVYWQKRSRSKLVAQNQENEARQQERERMLAKRSSEQHAREEELSRREHDVRKTQNRLDHEHAALKRDQQTLTEERIRLKGQHEELEQRERSVGQRESALRSREERATIAERKNAVLEVKIEQLMRSPQDLEKFRNDFAEFRAYQQTWPDTKRDLEDRESHLRREWERVSSELASLSEREAKLFSREVSLGAQEDTLKMRVQDVDRIVADAQHEANAIKLKAQSDSDELVRAKTVEYEEAARTRRENDGIRAGLEVQCRQQEQASAILTAREQELRERESHTESKLAEAQAAEHAAQTLQQSAADDRRQAESQREAAGRIKAEMDAFRKAAWPEWATANALTPSVEELWKDVVAGDASALWLCSQVQVLVAMERESGSRGFAALSIAIREVGKALAAYGERNGSTPEESNRLMVTWARTLNQVFGGKALIGVPAPGDPFDASSMQTDKPGLRGVNRTLGWWVKNNQAIVAWKAEVA